MRIMRQRITHYPQQCRKTMDNPVDGRGLEFAGYVVMYIMCHVMWHYFGSDIKWIMSRIRSR